MSTKIALKSSHIYLDAELVTTIFGEIHFAYVTYVEEQKKRWQRIERKGERNNKKKNEQYK